jgi:hypothetical protein
LPVANASFHVPLEVVAARGEVAEVLADDELVDLVVLEAAAHQRRRPALRRMVPSGKKPRLSPPRTVVARQTALAQRLREDERIGVAAMAWAGTPASASC